LFVNEHGQVAGASATNTTIDPFTKFPTLDPFLWDQKHGMQDLGTLGGSFSIPTAMNGQGQVVGVSYPEGQLNHAFLWTAPGPMKDLGTLGGLYSNANAINEAGVVVGGSNTAHNQFHAFLWKSGVLTDLDPVDACSEALSINSKEQVVGFLCGTPRVGHAVLWENGRLIDLNNMFNYPGSGLQELAFANSINDQGEIVGQATPVGCSDVFSCGHTYVLTPCDENHPGLEGCDYSPIEVRPAPPTLTGAAASSFQSPPQL
jgi:probable HAF family extracellular repeat protein